MTTIYQVAEKAGVSLSTVSRVLNGKGTVNAEMAQKVKKAAEELDYKPNQNARSLAAKHTNTVGIVLPNQNMLFYAHLLFSIEQLFRKYQKRCLIAFSSDSLKSEDEAINYLHLQGCDGVIVCSMRKNTRDKTPKTHKTLFFNPMSQVNSSVAVEANAINVVSLAFDYLKQRDHNDIALITHCHIDFDTTNTSAFSSQYTFVSQQQCANDAVLELVSSERPFSALVCTSQTLALSAHALLHELGFEVPQDISILTACLPGEVEPKKESKEVNTVTTLEFSTYDIASHLVNSALQHFYDSENKNTSALLPVLHDYGSVSAY